MDDVAEIAAGLTKAQRAAVAGAKSLLFGKRWVLSAKLNEKVSDNLRRLGLAEREDIYRDRLTANGEAVRAHLEKNT